MRTRAAWLWCVGAAGLCGCGGGSPAAPKHTCPEAYTLSVGPVTAAADHSAAPPGNQQKFSAAMYPEVVSTPTGCAVAQVVALVNAQWTSSDPLNVSISSAPDATNGLATCTGMTAAPVTLTASYVYQGVTKTGSATLSCK